MIEVTIFQDQEKTIGFRMEGHAGFAESGKDIVCAAVSVLAINTINGIEQFTDDAFTLDVPKDADKTDDNRIDFRFTDDISKEAEVLMKTMVLGLTEIQNNYGNSYLTLSFEEV